MEVVKITRKVYKVRFALQRPFDNFGSSSCSQIVILYPKLSSLKNQGICHFRNAVLIADINSKMKMIYIL